MLNVKNRQKYLLALGIYDGPISGVENTKTKRAYKEFQKKYFKRRKDLTGIYDTNTDNLLISAMRVKTYTKNFDVEEFRCPCGKCCGYPTTIKADLLKNLQSLRDDFKAPITITSGLRCRAANSELNNAITKSKHLIGKAADVYISKRSNSVLGRRKIIKIWMRYPKATYAYQGTKQMGNATHVDVK